jgi:hypothetical protein
VLKNQHWPVAVTTEGFTNANGITFPDVVSGGAHAAHPPGALHDIYVKFPAHLCEGTKPYAVETLAQAMVHEAIHVCQMMNNGGRGQGLTGWAANWMVGDPEEEIVANCFGSKK